MSWSTSELRVGLVPWNRFKPSSKIFLLTVPRRYLCFLCLVCLMLSRLFIAALWSPPWKGVTYWSLLVMFIVCLLLSHVVSWVRIVSFPDLCRLSYFSRYMYWGSLFCSAFIGNFSSEVSVPVESKLFGRELGTYHLGKKKNCITKLGQNARLPHITGATTRNWASNHRNTAKTGNSCSRRVPKNWKKKSMYDSCCDC